MTADTPRRGPLSNAERWDGALLDAENGERYIVLPESIDDAESYRHVDAIINQCRQRIIACQIQVERHGKRMVRLREMQREYLERNKR